MFSDTIMYKALIEKDTSFEGLFVAAIKTTGIFCRPVCTARKPKIENVEFFDTAKEAILHGYRPCKICNPLVTPGVTPEYIRLLLDEIHANPSQKITDADLRRRSIEPDRIRRWFMRYHGVTFHAYQRLYRINSAFKMIRDGGSVTDTAFASGYESLSGFNDTFKTIVGVPPSSSKDRKFLDMTRIETPLGPMIACANEQGVYLLEFTDRRMLETELKELSDELDTPIIQGNNPHFIQLKRQLDEYFEGRRTEFTVPLITEGTEFQKQAWKYLATIPYGSTVSYKHQATGLSNAAAVRAIARANGMNRIAILIPCHRVVGENGDLTGYAGGLWRKKWLLDLEKKHAQKVL
jgi:AraC family transcriptional regulator of adaptative response/methylated-DNA-[protein]-cysteine methyltransferase